MKHRSSDLFYPITSDNKKKLNGCDQEHSDCPTLCPAWGKTCNSCGRLNHFLAVSRSLPSSKSNASNTSAVSTTPDPGTEGKPWKIKESWKMEGCVLAMSPKQQPKINLTAVIDKAVCRRLCTHNPCGLINS